MSLLDQSWTSKEPILGVEHYLVFVREEGSLKLVKDKKDGTKEVWDEMKLSELLKDP